MEKFPQKMKRKKLNLAYTIFSATFQKLPEYIEREKEEKRERAERFVLILTLNIRICDDNVAKCSDSAVNTL